MSAITAETPLGQLKKVFAELANQWREEPLYLSSSTDIAKHPAYQRIIGLGPPVIPLILAEMRREPGHWFWALRALTGADPVPASDRGRLQGMTNAWLQWGQANGCTE